MIRPVHAVALALLAACTFEHRVLDDPQGVVTTCDEVWFAVDGAPCAFDELCERPTPTDPVCCSEWAYCTDDGLFFASSCDSACGCRTDDDCSYGEALCEDTVCQSCPSTELCSPCPDGWVPLARNGCPTCACAPPSECELAGPSCDPSEECYPGRSCADGCDASQPGCCSNACSVSGCQDLAPMGCLMDCDPGQGCSLCAADYCECDGIAWSCLPVCVDELQASCVFP